jgi:hypothetical protein
MVTYIVRCKNCRKQFERLYEERARDICYSCALKELCGNFVPEEGDFNSARIISGEMTEQEERWLQEDLKAVESGRSIREWDLLPESQEWECPCCGEDLSNCYCDENERDE